MWDALCRGGVVIMLLAWGFVGLARGRGSECRGPLDCVAHEHYRFSTYGVVGVGLCVASLLLFSCIPPEELDLDNFMWERPRRLVTCGVVYSGLCVLWGRTSRYPGGAGCGVHGLRFLASACRRGPAPTTLFAVVLLVIAFTHGTDTLLLAVTHLGFASLT